ncbi:polyprenyl synthetase family protein [Nocardia bovistercoris]|uniref:Polyprenyl synthetase family protein n=1 Tax=Nocardia bovistercoris TaxID=2785916 RepID=A0A931N225_9NOCA|nr:polyprenyl synthetase family protein [Nocardia bovistercoris]MBH0775566.1 polyprenyl synthetase family protein [Nocardia bovistercoris]
MTASPTTVLADLTSIRTRVDDALASFLRAKAGSGAARRLPEEVVTTLDGFLFGGGKRIRPVLCVLGWLAGGGDPEVPAPVVRAAASLELFHASVLIHDDIIDDSDTRRDRPTVHRVLTDLHRDRRDPERFGAGAAIVLGDLTMVWAAELLHTAQLAHDRLAAALAVLDSMRADVMYGQYLDLLATACPTDDLERALQIVRYKTVSYTCERPLHLGAALADAPPEVRTALTAYARPLGEAFQLRDDLLGVFGDPAHSGKSNLDDLREGKHTALVALALEHASEAEAARLRTLLGDPDLDERAAQDCREILAASARPRVEDMIAARWELAIGALRQPPYPAEVAGALRRIADAAVLRTS